MKVYPFTIPKRPDDNIIVQVDQGQQFYNRLHQHQEIQLSYILSGQGRLVIGNNVTTYGPNDLIGIGANLPHLFQSNKDNKESHMISLFFLKNCFGTSFFSSKEMGVLNSTFEEFSIGVKLTTDNSTQDLLKSLPGLSRFEVFMALMRILKICATKEKTLINKKGFISKLSANQGQRLQEVMDFTLRNFDKPIALEEVAEKAHLGRNSFCRFFKQRTNKTYFQFLAEVRIHYATELLIKKQDIPIGEIAIKSGYQSISNFNRQFKSIQGVNAKTYRKNSVSKF